MTAPIVRVQTHPFDMTQTIEQLRGERTDIGAVASFCGYVRDFSENPGVLALTLEHYPGMTEQVLQQIAQTAQNRWALSGVRVIHRIGRMEPGDPIVLVVTASPHRHAALEACAYIMDQLKTRAPFWKKEHTAQGDYWVEARSSDTEAANRWEQTGHE